MVLNPYRSPRIAAAAASAWRLSRAVFIGVSVVVIFFSGYGLGYWKRMSEEYNPHWRTEERIDNESLAPGADEALKSLRDASIRRAE